MENPLPDAHIHLAALDIPEVHPALCVTCSPNEFAATQPRYGHVALGLHPWLITEENADELLYAFTCELPRATLIGEVGLDFYKRYARFSGAQLRCFQSICALLREGSYVVSIHSRAADKETLDIIESNGLSSSSLCVMHGFNGPSDQMARAMRMGCMFSMGSRELATKRGREYARQLPTERIVLETDADGSKPFTEEDWAESLEEALGILSKIKGHDMRGIVADNFNRVIGKA